MDYNVVINGIPVEAHYSAHAVGEIFVPLLKKLTELQKKGEKEDQLRKRLIDRRVKTGVEEKASAEFVDFSDMPNVRLCLEHSKKADLILELDRDGDYHVTGEAMRSDYSKRSGDYDGKITQYHDRVSVWLYPHS